MCNFKVFIGHFMNVPPHQLTLREACPWIPGHPSPMVWLPLPKRELAISKPLLHL